MLNKVLYTILGIGIAFLFLPHGSRDLKKPVVSGITTQVAEASPQVVAPEMVGNVTSPQLTAKSGVVYDLNSGTVLFSQNLDEKLPIASLTKLMTAIVVVNHAKLDDQVTIAKEDLTSIGSTVGLVEGEKITVRSLLKAMLIPSGNDAALALADFVGGTPEKFADMMNQQARDLNLVATNFSNPVGWDSWYDKDNFSNSLDLVKIVQEFLKHDELRQIAKTKQTQVFSVDGKYNHSLRTTNQLLLDDPNVEGLKTGFTSKALGNLVILYNHNGNYILSVVLGSENREDDSRQLLNWILKVYQW